MAEAIQYALGQWDELNVFCRDGAVPLDNNVSERERKRIVLNRKNLSLSGTRMGDEPLPFCPVSLAPAGGMRSIRTSI